MRKLFRWIVAFVFVGLLANFILLPAYYRAQIRNVLAKDKANSDLIQSHLSFADKWWDQSEYFGNIVSGMRQIDLSGCPVEFSNAYLAHIDAWERGRLFLHENVGWNGFVKGFLSGGGAIVSIYRQGAAADKAIQQTWGNVLLIAQKHGVSPPQGAG